MPALRYAITDRILYGHSEGERQAGLLKQAERLVETGTGYIQLREKDLSAKELLGLTRRMLEVLRRAKSFPKRRPRLLVNSRADVAAAAGADGVHLTSGEGQLTPGQARLVLNRVAGSAEAERAVVSVSCHNLAEVERACAGGADLVLFGPVFGKWVHGNLLLSSIQAPVDIAATGLDGLREACAVAGEVPVLALGGVTAQNTAECIAAGAAGVAGIRLFL